MNPIVLHVASAHSFFSFAALVLVGVLLVGPDRSRLRNGVGHLLMLAVLIAALAPALPFPRWSEVVGTGLALGVVLLGSSERWPRVRRTLKVSLVTVGVVYAAVALRWQWPPTVDIVGARRMDVLGDSISVGLDGVEPWTSILGRRYDVAVRTHALRPAPITSMRRICTAYCIVLAWSWRWLALWWMGHFHRQGGVP